MKVVEFKTSCIVPVPGSGARKDVWYSREHPEHTFEVKNGCIVIAKKGCNSTLVPLTSCYYVICEP